MNIIKKMLQSILGEYQPKKTASQIKAEAKRQRKMARNKAAL